jgi:hypothetical protein
MALPVNLISAASQEPIRGPLGLLNPLKRKAPAQRSAGAVMPKAIFADTQRGGAGAQIKPHGRALG